MSREEMRLAELRKQAARTAAEKAHNLVLDIGKQSQSIGAGLSSASATLTTVSYKVIKNARGAEEADRWLKEALQMAVVGLHEHGLDVQFSIGRLPSKGA